MMLNERIAALRRAAGLSQEALAAGLGVSRQTIGKWEAGISLPGVENLQALASALHISCDELLTGEKPPAGEDAPPEGMTTAAVAALLNAENAAREQGARRQHRFLLALTAILACVCVAVIVCGIVYSQRMRALSEELNGLVNRFSGLEGSMDARINAMQNTIQSSLAEQASILANYDWQYGVQTSSDAVPLSLNAMPKTLRAGMTAMFTVTPAAGAPLAFPAREQDGVFYAEASIPLEERFDSFAISVSFTQDGETQSQTLMNEVDFITSRRTTVQLRSDDFRTALNGTWNDAHTMTLGGTVALEVERGWAGYAPIPVSAAVELIVDGEVLDRQELSLAKDFAPSDWAGESPDGGQTSSSGGDASAQASLAVSSSLVIYYPRFEQVEVARPTQGAEVVASVTDSSGAVITARLQLYIPEA